MLQDLINKALEQLEDQIDQAHNTETLVETIARHILPINMQARLQCAIDSPTLMTSLPHDLEAEEIMDLDLDTMLGMNIQETLEIAMLTWLETNRYHQCGKCGNWIRVLGWRHSDRPIKCTSCGSLYSPYSEN